MPNTAGARCGECGFHNDDQARFCVSCGTNLHESCPQCGGAIRARQNFCRACGEPLSPIQADRPRVSTPEHLASRISPVQAERKIATVLFADIANSTDAIKDLDPEDAKRFLVPAVEAMTNAIHRYEGIVIRDRGDGLMASFGAPIALEDHAIRACYAALEMQNSIRPHAEEVARRLGTPLEIRVGINSGPILVTVRHEPGGGRDVRVDGLATHIAARLEPLATPGTILLTRETRVLADGFVDARELGSRRLRGIQEPISVYQLEGVNTRIRIQALAARRMSKFVGRQTEIEILGRRASQAKSGRGQVVALVGDAGIGKSRVVLEFIHSNVMSGWQVLEAGSVSYGKATAYLPLVDLVTRYFDVQARDGEEQVLQRIVEKLSGLGDEKLLAQTAFFMAALGKTVNDDVWIRLMPIERQRGIFEALKRLLIRESQRQPLCLVFEDLHWVDPETHAFLDMLLDSVPAARLLMLVNYRPEHKSRWTGRSYFSELRLDPLPSESSAELLEMLLGSDGDLDAAKQALIDLTEGNPLFLEESARGLMESGMLAGTSAQRQALGSLLSGFVPHTIEALLNSRVDRLQAEIKQTLQCAAVIGFDIPRDLLGAVAGSGQDIERSVRELQAAELLYEKTLFPDTVYSFKHAITREVVYATLTRERKTELHARTAHAMVALAAGRIDESVERVAQHAELGALHEMALEYLERAGVKAYGLYANREAADFFQRALKMLAQLPESRATLEHAVDLRFELRNALIALSELERIRDCLEEIEAILARLGDKVRGARHAAFRCNHHFLAGEQRQAIQIGDAGLRLAQECGDGALEGELLYRVGQCFHLLGENGRAIALLEKSVQLTDEHYERQRFELSVIPAVVSRTWLVSALAECGHFKAGMAHAKRAIEISETAEHPLSEVLGWLALGHVLRRKGEIDGAIVALERGLALCGRYALPLWRLRLLSSLGIACASHGRVAEGLEMTQQALSEADSIGLRVDQPMFHVHIGFASLLAERAEDALKHGEQALTLARVREGKGDEGWARFLAGCARLAFDKKAVVESGADLRAALELASVCGARPLMAFCQTALAAIHSTYGQSAEAEAIRAAADALYRDLDMRPLKLTG